MQSIILYFLIAIVSSIFLSNFLNCAKENNGNDFNIKYFINNFKITNIEIKYTFVFFILFYLLSKYILIKEIVLYILLCFSLLLAFCMDIKYMIIPDTSSIIILLSAVLKIIISFSVDNLKSSILGFIFGGLFFYIINAIFEAFTKKVGFGYGDMKLFASIGLFFGVKDIAVLIVMSIFISAIYSIGYLFVCFIKNKNGEYLPFGPFIVISTLIICIIPASKIIDIYFNLINKIIGQ